MAPQPNPGKAVSASDPPPAAHPLASRRQAQPGTLPDDHLALVVEDALAAGDSGQGAAEAPSAEQARRRELRAALLYAWATGAFSAGDLVRRATNDPGMRFVLRGHVPTDDEVRAFRQRTGPALAAAVAEALRVCAGAGVAALGEIDLDAAATQGFEAAAAELLARADHADERDAWTETVWRADLPPGLVPRRLRRAAFLAAHVGPSVRSALPPPISTRPARHYGRLRPVASALAVVALLIGGLIATRWIAVAPVAGAASGARQPVNVPAALPTAVPRAGQAALPTTLPTSIPTDQLDLAGARDEAMRLGAQALGDDDLESAHTFYLLAREALQSDDPEADARVRELETALGIGDRTGNWVAAVNDLADLRTVAPDAQSLLQAYVTALVGAGREALRVGNRAQAATYCDEATRWFPSRDDAQACLAAAGGRTATATPVRSTSPATPSPIGVPAR
ncbi:MAG: hypothetical protein QOF51_955 [Chloroflexota bacterium]|jgi:hypothetical protein|nr:hypothetical protein [Chloroflexota bacterium]